MPEMWRCRHHHTGISHPACWHEYILEYGSKQLKIGYLDIEANGLQGDFNYMYSWAIKTRGKNEVRSECLTVPKDLISKRFDRDLVKHLLEAMREYDLLVTYYGTGFDIPFIRTRALKWGLDFPAYGEIKHHDLYYVVKSKLKLHRNSLFAVTAILNIDEKTPLKPNTWQEAMVDQTKMNYILKHNVQDVIVLEQAHDKLMKFMKGMKRSL